MPTQRQVSDTISQALYIMTRYQNGERTPERAAHMQVEVQVLASWVSEWGWDWRRVDGHVAGPVRAGLLDRYGQEVGPRLLAEFADAFDCIFA